MIMKLKCSKGFSLIELSIALMIATVFVLGIFSLYSQSIVSTKKMNERFIALNLAKNRLERLRSFEYAVLPTANETDAYLNQQGSADPDGAYLRNTTIATDYNGMADLTQVTVTVDYKMKGQFTGNPVVLTTVFVNE